VDIRGFPEVIYIACNDNIILGFEVPDMILNIKASIANLAKMLIFVVDIDTKSYWLVLTEILNHAI